MDGQQGATGALASALEATEVYEARLVQKVTDLLLAGLTLDQIGTALDLSSKTVKNLRKQAVRSWRESAAESYEEFALAVNARLMALLAPVWAGAVEGNVGYIDVALGIIKTQMRLMELAPGIANANQLSAERGGPLEALESQFSSIIERRLAAIEGGGPEAPSGGDARDPEVA